MLRHRLSMPSPATVISMVALFAALGGTGYAASRIVSPRAHSAAHLTARNKRQIRKIALSVVDKRITDRAASLTVGHASTADTATNATNAGKATNATNATNAGFASTAGNATSLQGQGPSAFEPSSNFARSGLVTASLGHTVTLATFGPFTVSLQCIDHGGGSWEARLNARSSEANSEAFGTQMPNANSDVNFASTTSTSFSDSDNAVADFIAPSGAVFQVLPTVGVHPNFNTGVPCFGDIFVTKG